MCAAAATSGRWLLTCGGQSNARASRYANQSIGQCSPRDHPVPVEGNVVKRAVRPSAMSKDAGKPRTVILHNCALSEQENE